MNKKLVALAVAGACALPVMAQAQTANVTLYGRVHLGMELVDGKQANGSNPHVFRINSNSSRFGIRGTESLGGGLNAIFQLESSVSWDAGGGTIAGRESFVGLQGGWGTVKMGNFLVPYDDIHSIFLNVGPYGSSIINHAGLWGGDSGTAGGGTLDCTNGSFDCRAPNSVRYDTPNLSGFTGSVQYFTREGSPVSHASGTSAGVFYNNGPIWVGTAYNYYEDIRGVGLDDNAWTIAGSWNFGFMRLAGVYETVKYGTPTGDLKKDFWGATAIVPFGAASSIQAFYGKAGQGKGGASDLTTAIGGLRHGSDTGADQWDITYNYLLSKRTNVYFGYIKINNECRAAYSFHINPYTIANSVTGNPCAGKPSGFVLGAVHNF